MKDLMHEAMIDCFLSLEGDHLEDKSPKDILWAWVTWIDSRYKVAEIPDVCYAIIDCETGELISMMRLDIPGAKEQARTMCASLNDDHEPDQEHKTTDQGEKMVDMEKVAEAFLNMDEEEFMNFLIDNTPGEKEE